jgi:hypothetical protein
MPVILATQEERSGGSRFEASPGKQVSRLYLKKTHHKKRAGGVAQGVGPEFKPSIKKKKKKRKKSLFFYSYFRPLSVWEICYTAISSYYNASDKNVLYS